MSVIIIMASIFTHPEFINSYLISNEDENDLLEERKIVSLGNSLFRKGLEVREFDIEMECGGNSVKAWINSLDIVSIEILSQKIKLTSYCKMLLTENLISLEQSELDCKENYAICLYYYYYLKPNFSILQKKMNFQINKFVNNDNEQFECPICITWQDVDEKIMFQCSHSVCNCCFHSYIDSLKTGFVTCSLCRDVVKSIFVKKEDYLCRIEKKYN